MKGSSENLLRDSSAGLDGVPTHRDSVRLALKALKTIFRDTLKPLSPQYQSNSLQ